MSEGRYNYVHGGNLIASIRENYHVIKRGDKLYPDSLLDAPCPPEKIFVYGNLKLLEKEKIAVVGSRDCSEYGKKMSEKIATKLSEADKVVVSGLARGIDSYAHIGGLKGEGGTIGILGCGLDICYPASNWQLFERVANEGLLISEWELGSQPRRYTFPMRNRLIAAISAATVVVEAATRSGALITAELAIEMGREVYSMPGNISSINSLGTNRLIQYGARPLVVIEEMLRDLGLK